MRDVNRQAHAGGAQVAQWMWNGEKTSKMRRRYREGETTNCKAVKWNITHLLHWFTDWSEVEAADWEDSVSWPSTLISEYVFIADHSVKLLQGPHHVSQEVNICDAEMLLRQGVKWVTLQMCGSGCGSRCEGQTTYSPTWKCALPKNSSPAPHKQCRWIHVNSSRAPLPFCDHLMSIKLSVKVNNCKVLF